MINTKSCTASQHSLRKESSFLGVMALVPNASLRKSMSDLSFVIPSSGLERRMTVASALAASSMSCLCLSLLSRCSSTSPSAIPILLTRDPIWILALSRSSSWPGTVGGRFFEALSRTRPMAQWVRSELRSPRSLGVIANGAFHGSAAIFEKTAYTMAEPADWMERREDATSSARPGREGGCPPPPLMGDVPPPSFARPDSISRGATLVTFVGADESRCSSACSAIIDSSLAVRFSFQIYSYDPALPQRVVLPLLITPCLNLYYYLSGRVGW